MGEHSVITGTLGETVGRDPARIGCESSMAQILLWAFADLEVGLSFLYFFASCTAAS